MIKIAIWGEIPHMNPFYPTDEKIWSLQSLIWEPFIVIDETGKWHPYLAKTWKFNEDKTQITFNLPDQLRWNDGTLVTKEDLEFSFAFYEHQVLKASHWSAIFNNIKKVSFKKDQLTIELKSFSGVGDWNNLLSMARLLPADVLNNFESKIKKLKGTGVYRIKNFSSVKPWNLQINPYFRDQNQTKSYPKEVQISKVFSANVLQDIFLKKKVFAFVDYGLQKNIKSSYYPYKSQTMYKVIAYNLADTFLRLKKNRLCLSLFLPEAKEMQKLASLKIDQYLNVSSKNNKECLYVEKQKISALYVHDEDKKWLGLWQQNLKAYGLDLDLTKVSESKMNEMLKNKSFQILVSDMRDNYNQYPKDVFHSEGAYNSQSWAFKRLDQLLEEKQKQFNEKKIKTLNAQIRSFLEQETGLVYFYSYKNPLAKTKSDCQNQNLFWHGLLNCY